MKNNFKKIMSLLLTVVMLLGTVSAVIPFSASAESVSNQNVTVNQDGTVTITPNTDAVYNGVTYRFDVKDGNTNSVATINPDGSVQVTYSAGDMFWFPDVQMTDESSVHAEVTAISTSGHKYTGSFSSMKEFYNGFAYGITTDANGWAKATMAVYRDARRCRITNVTKTGLANNNGGDSHIINDSAPATTNSLWGAVSDAEGHWAFGKEIIYDVKHNAQGDISVTMAGSEGVFQSYTYNNQSSNAANSTYAGAVGFAPVWSGSDAGAYATIRIDKLILKNCTVDGQNKEQYSVLDYKDAYTTINGTYTDPDSGIVYRFDVYSGNTESYARVFEDGSIEIKYRHGDMLWFPEVVVTEGSSIHAEVTAIDTEGHNTKSSLKEYYNGLAYGIVADNDGVWSTATMAVYRDARRCRVTDVTRSGLGTVNGSDRGNGGSSPRIANDDGSQSNTDQWKAVTDSEGHWAFDKQVVFDVYPDDETTAVSFSGSAGTFKTFSKNTTSGYSHHAFEGAVGFAPVWANSDGYAIIRIDKLTITNCTVGEQAKKYYSVLDGQDENDIYKLSANLSLDGVIGFNVKVDANDYIRGTETLVVTDKASEPVVETTLADIWNTDGGYYACTIPVNAKEMTDTFTVTLKDGEAVIATYSNLSVKSYAEALKEDEDWKDLMTAMLNYGAAAQNLFDYNTENPAADLTNFDFDMKDVEGNDIGLPTITGTDTTIISDLSASLVLESNTALKLYFKNATDADLTVTVNNKAAVLTEANDGLLCLTISDIAADQLADEIVVSINEGALVITISACEWAKTVVENESDANMITLAKALAAYATAAASKN